ncbi:triosephosphate isomerase [Pseudoloma neurophilia]|uniref:Triosephosphate isomerase n=1 Tax=Pseudoloma neurophilia TaxID=146866 RepID=A0A0R0MAB1_9MICR|nr:triosephosphate isomerase [Pseudoloma neurophilia]
MKKLLACNLKMSCDLKMLENIKSFMDQLKNENIDRICAVPFPYLQEAKKQLETNQITQVFAQDISQFESGAHTGEVSAKMLKDLKVFGTLIGHSERRQFLNESDDSIKKKIELSIMNNLRIIFCIGESLSERESNQTLKIIEQQMAVVVPFLEKAEIIIAYEPVWAIGTGKVPTNEEISEACSFIQEKYRLPYKNGSQHVLYGGSVNEKNAAELSKIKEVTGFLVGGCSCTPGIVDVGKALSK